MTDNERKAILGFLDVYRSLPALWNMKTEAYNSRTRKEKQYNILLRKYKEIKPEADKKELKKKLNTLRTNFRRELKRKKDLEKSGQPFETTLYYFDKLSFLAEMENSIAKSENSFERQDEKVLQSTSIKKKKHRPVNSDELLELATKRLKRSDDYSQTLANVWANEFRLASEEQRFFAKKAIDDILFEARCGTLHRNSVKINESNLNDYSDFQPGHSKCDTYQSISPRSNHDSITIERIGIENQEDDEC